MQIRYRTVTWTDEEGNEHESEEAYEYYILHVTLRNHSLGTVAVENLTEDEKGRYAAILELKGNKPYLFGDNIYANPSEGEHYDKFCKEPNVSDKINANEAAIVVDLLRRIHRFYGERFDAKKTVGVIVPYRNQIAMVRKGIEKLGIPELEKISIDTVERYQGSQRDVIIYSFTIQNIWQLDFLAGNSFVEDGAIIDRKLNVAITRARKQMIMTGNPEILRNNQIFSELMNYVKEKGGYF